MEAQIKSLFLKEKHGQPMTKVGQMELIRGYGIQGDVNADNMSPRQILIVRNEDLEHFNIPLGGLRENIVIDNIDTSVFKPGSLLQIGRAKIRLTFNCEPCKRISQYVKPSEIMGKRGILGVVVEGGIIRDDMTVSIYPHVFYPLSDLPFDRFKHFVSQIPAGKVVTYKEITRGMGVAESYLRAIPNYITKAGFDLPVHRIVDSEGNLIHKYIPDQKNLLMDEKVMLKESISLFNESEWFVALEHHLWNDALFLN
ncbi:MGMT family protein [Larkinella bovis]|uniref:MGMT family protein n=1 Tax=Larkinella bovis TaxID=683041 RepID=A0ABW0II84_9BACT